MMASRLIGKKFYPYILGGVAVPREASDALLPVIDKYTLQPAADVGLAGEATIKKAFALAEESKGALKKMGNYERKGVLMNIVDQLRARQDELANVISIEAGKPINDANVEVTRAIETFTIAAEESTRGYGEFIPLDTSARNAGFSMISRRFPVGVISMISPFNFPLNLVAHKVAPAIAAGCPFVLKPSEKTPITALLIGEMLQRTALPPPSYSVLPSALAHASLFVDDPAIALISFTGSDVVGWQIKAKAVKKKVVLELGGNAACIVDASADVAVAAERILMGAFMQCGQSCISVQRVYAHRSIYDELKRRLIDGTKKLDARHGDPLDKNTFVGPMIEESQAIRVQSWIQSAVDAGARILTGGERNRQFHQLTILENAPVDQPVMYREIFGPAFCIQPFDDFRNVIDQVNHSTFGLQTGLFTNDFNRVFYAFENLEVGGVVINDIPSVRADAQPYGGIKDSGVGREGVRSSIEEFTELKALILKNPSVLPQ